MSDFQTNEKPSNKVPVIRDRLFSDGILKHRGPSGRRIKTLKSSLTSIKREDGLFLCHSPSVKEQSLADRKRSAPDALARSRPQRTNKIVETLKLPNIEHITRPQSMESSQVRFWSDSDTSRLKPSIKKVEEKVLSASSSVEDHTVLELLRSVSEVRAKSRSGPKNVTTENLKVQNAEPDMEERSTELSEMQFRSLSDASQIKRREPPTITATAPSIRNIIPSPKKWESNASMPETFDFSDCLISEKRKKEHKSYESIASYPEMSREKRIAVYTSMIISGFDMCDAEEHLKELLMEEKYESRSKLSDMVPKNQISSACSTPPRIQLEPTTDKPSRKISMPPIGSGSMVDAGSGFRDLEGLRQISTSLNHLGI